MQDSDDDFWQAHFTLYAFESPASRDVFERLLMEWANRFTRGQQKYRDVKHLGAKGVFPDVNRKTGRLESDIWEERTPPEGAEPTREVILDLIGHLFLMLHLWDQEPLHGLEELTDEEAQAFEDSITDEERVRRASQAAYERSQRASYRMTPQQEMDAARAAGNPCPNPHAHGDGWEDLPHAAREVLRRIAAGDRVGNVEREQVKILVEKHAD
jgi:hypothetical protein